MAAGIQQKLMGGGGRVKFYSHSPNTAIPVSSELYLLKGLDFSANSPSFCLVQRMTIKLLSGISSKCLVPLRTQYWPIQQKEKSIMYSGHQPNQTG